VKEYLIRLTREQVRAIVSEIPSIRDAASAAGIEIDEDTEQYWRELIEADQRGSGLEQWADDEHVETLSDLLSAIQEKRAAGDPILAMDGDGLPVDMAARLVVNQIEVRYWRERGGDPG
jgi:hypothetical protein